MTAAEFFETLTGRGMRLRLDAMEALLAALGDPHAAFAWVHVGGTNGKGSVAAMTEAMLIAAGHRVGLYTSPHLVRFEERVRVDGTEVSDAAVAEGLARLRPAMEKVEAVHGPVTYFEAASAFAFDHFARAGVDLAVVEVGLGGRLDATNVHPAPLVTVVTNVGRDHMDVLGDDLAQIAREKAAIFRPGVPAVTGAEGEALEAIVAEAARVGAPLRVLGRDVVPERLSSSPGGERFRLGGAEYATDLVGAHQVANAALALEAVRAVDARGFAVPEGARRKGLLSTRWPGRLQRLPGTPVVLLDGAHNPDGAHALARHLREIGLKPTLLFGVLQDKAWLEMVETLAEVVSGAVVTRPPNARALAPREAAREFSRAGVVGTVVEDVGHALATAEGQAGPDGVVLVAGSLYLVGDVLARRGVR